MLTVQFAQDFAEEGVTFLAVSPGVSAFTIFFPCPHWTHGDECEQIC